MAALLLMVAWNMSEAHKVINLLRHAPKDDIVVMLMCMSLTVLFDMVIAISVGIVLASLLFAPYRTHDSSGAGQRRVPDDVLVLQVSGPLFFAAAEGCSTIWSPDRRQAHRGAEMGRGAGSRRRWLDAFQRFVNKLPEGCDAYLTSSFSRYARWRAARQAAARTPELPRSPGRWLTCDHRRQVLRLPHQGSSRLLQPGSAPPASSVPFIKCGSCSIARRNFCNVCGGYRRRTETVQATPGPAPDPTPSPALRPPARLMQLRHQRRPLL